MPCEITNTSCLKAKQTINNRLAGRAAKGAIPVDRTKNSGIPRGIPLFFCVVYSLQTKYLYAGSREKRSHTLFKTTKNLVGILTILLSHNSYSVKKTIKTGKKDIDFKRLILYNVL
ncbi:MAG: hypothetical protein IKA20_01260 [Clostridia bacterium]|nr:hypothetical protein [Clostridia bacterium]